MIKQLPVEFATRMQQQLQAQYGNYVDAISLPPPISVRVNPKKITSPLPLEGVAWCADGYYLPTRPIFTFDPLFQAGAYYVQEAGSMFIGWAMQHLDIKDQALKVLDLCAAPGGKSTQLLSSISPQSLLVANEVIKTRVSVLKENIEKWGYPNAVVTHNDPKDFEALEGFFDVVVVDAPCSGEGLFRKDPNAIKEWSPNNVQLCSQRQQRILVSAQKTLKRGGYMLYSTCTHAPQENEDNVRWIIENFGFEEVKIPLPQDSGIEESEFGYRFYPHKTKAEGFYCAILRKTEGKDTTAMRPRRNAYNQEKKASNQLLPFFDPEYDLVAYLKQESLYVLPYKHFEPLNILAEKLRIVSVGTETGAFIKEDLIPAQGLAHSIALKSGMFEALELDPLEALRFLRKDPIIDPSGVTGWKIATHKGQGLGFLKNLGNRTNNYFPKERRILKQPNLDELFCLM